MAPDCPWYVSAHAVRRWLVVTRAAMGFDDASDALINYCADTWLRRYSDGTRSPRITKTGAYIYRGINGIAGRLGLVVSPDIRPEGPLPALVDVLPEHG